MTFVRRICAWALTSLGPSNRPRHDSRGLKEACGGCERAQRARGWWGRSRAGRANSSVIKFRFSAHLLFAHGALSPSFGAGRRGARGEAHAVKANARASDAEPRAADASGFECAAARASDADPGWSSYVPVPLVVVGAAWFCSLCFVVVRALRLIVRCPPTPRRFRSVCGCFDCSSWSLRRMSRRRAGFRRTSCLIVIICARAAGCCRCCVVPFVFFVVVRALRLFVRSPPTPRRFRSGCGCFSCSSS